MQETVGIWTRFENRKTRFLELFSNKKFHILNSATTGGDLKIEAVVSKNRSKKGKKLTWIFRPGYGMIELSKFK
jgi:hypothetical protein